MKLIIIFCLFFVRCAVAGDVLPLSERLQEDGELRVHCGNVYHALNDITEAYDAVNSRIIDGNVQIEMLFSKVMELQSCIGMLSAEIDDLESALGCSDGYRALV